MTATELSAYTQFTADKARAVSARLQQLYPIEAVPGQTAPISFEIELPPIPAEIHESGGWAQSLSRDTVNAIIARVESGVTRPPLTPEEVQAEIDRFAYNTIGAAEVRVNTLFDTVRHIMGKAGLEEQDAEELLGLWPEEPVTLQVTDALLRFYARAPEQIALKKLQDRYGYVRTVAQRCRDFCIAWVTAQDAKAISSDLP